MDWEFVGSIKGKLLKPNGHVADPLVERDFNLSVKIIAGKIFYAVNDDLGNYINVRVVGSTPTHNNLKFSSGRVKISDEYYSIPLPNFDE